MSQPLCTKVIFRHGDFGWENLPISKVSTPLYKGHFSTDSKIQLTN